MARQVAWTNSFHDNFIPVKNPALLCPSLQSARSCLMLSAKELVSVLTDGDDRPVWGGRWNKPSRGTADSIVEADPPFDQSPQSPHSRPCQIPTTSASTSQFVLIDLRSVLRFVEGIFLNTRH